MKKNSYGLEYLYAVGAAITATGFCLPIFRHSITVLNKTVVMLSQNGFQLLSEGHLLDSAIFLAVFVLAIAGFSVSFIKIPRKKMVKTLLLAVGILCGLVFGYKCKDLIDGMKNFLYAGFYTIIAGWIVSILGLFAGK